MKRPDAFGTQARIGPRFNDEGFTEMYPELVEHLTATAYEDKSPRLTSTILMFVDNGTLKLCLNDRDNQRSAFVESDSFAGVLDSLEKQLREGTLEWKRKGQYNQGNNKTPF